MKALTIWQPWASLIAYADKRVENRTWRPPPGVIGQRIAIHAGKKIDGDASFSISIDSRFSVKARQIADGAADGTFVTGAILCTARVGGYDTKSDGNVWFAGPIGWALEDVRAFETVPARGAQGLWDVPADVLARIPEHAQ